MNAWNEVAKALKEVQAFHRRLRLQVIAYVACGILSLAVSGVLLGAHWQSRIFVWLWLLLFFCGFFVAGIWAWWRFLLPTKSLMRAAHLAEHLAPEMGTALRSAVDFEEQLESSEAPLSKDLVEKHFKTTAEKLGPIDFKQRLSARRAYELRSGTIFMVASLALCVLIGLFAEHVGQNLQRIIFPGENEEVSSNPITGNLQVLYKFPAYTHLSPRRVSGSDGNLQALHATEVELEGLSQFPIKGALVRFWDAGASQSREIPALVVDERGFRVSFSLLYDGHYNFVMINAEGERVVEGQNHRIHVIPDGYPSITMQGPTKDIELKDDESVRIKWEAKDDFAVAEVALVIDHKDGREANRIIIDKPRTMESIFKGRYKLSATELALGKENEAIIYLEVTDNDVISGPKKSVSGAKNIKLFSARDQHEALLKAQNELLDALVDGLAGELLGQLNVEKLKSAIQARDEQKKLHQVLSGLRGQVLVVLGELNKDKLTVHEQRSALENIAERLQSSMAARTSGIGSLERNPKKYKSIVKDLYAAIILPLEKDIIYFDDLLALRRVESLKETAQDLLSAQRELSQLIEKYRETPDPQIRAELSQRIKDLRRKMLDLLQRMSGIRKGLPGEYRNLEAARSLEMDFQLKRLEELLSQGDFDAAAAELEELANMVENMVDSIAQAEEDFGEDRYADIRQKLNQFSSDFAELEAMQNQVTDEGAALLDKKRREAVRALADDLDKLIKQLLDKIDEVLLEMDVLVDLVARMKLDSQFMKVRQRILDLGVLIENRDFAEAKDIGSQAKANFESFERLLDVRLNRHPQGLSDGEKKSISTIMSGIEEINKKLEKLFPEASDLKPSEKKQVKGIAEQQGKIAEEASKLEQMMHELSEELPIFGGEQHAGFKAAQNAMKNAMKSMQAEKLGEASLHGQEAASELAKLRQSLEGSGQQKRGLPMPMNFGSPLDRRSASGSGGARHEEVEIPHGMTELSEKKFRQKLLEAAKQKAPKRYEKAVQDYYEELIK